LIKLKMGVDLALASDTFFSDYTLDGGGLGVVRGYTWIKRLDPALFVDVKRFFLPWIDILVHKLIPYL